MLARRSFLRTSVAALLSQFIKLPELDIIEEPLWPAQWFLISPDKDSAVKYFYSQFSMGFHISKGLMDDVYGKLVEAAVQANSKIILPQTSPSEPSEET